MNKSITVSEQYPDYWQYKGKPVILLGASKEDNLFQIKDLNKHLSMLHSVGGNYIRCTMSSRDEGNVWPYEKKDGLYDLNKFSKEYWNKFLRLLKLTYEMDIIVQVEVWDRFDYARTPWQYNPFNPKNNINYTKEESLLEEIIDSHPNYNQSRFFFSIPEYDNNTKLLNYQKAFVDKLLSYTIEYPHILYCMDNETAAVEEWGRYWAEYIKNKAAKKGLKVHTTEMWDKWDLKDKQHEGTFAHPEIYNYCDISQNNHNNGDKHWEGLMWVRKRIATENRPLNNVKIYGSDLDSKFGCKRDAIQRFWMCIFGKAASARFHRPPSGMGLSKTAANNIKSMRMILNEIDIFKCKPYNNLLIKRRENQAYCTAVPNKEIAVFLVDNSKVTVDTSMIKGNLIVKQLNINESKMTKRKVSERDKLTLTNNTQDFNAFVIKEEPE